MSDTYSEYGRSDGRKRGSLLMRLLDMLMTLLTAVIAVAMVIIFLIPYVEPAHMWFFPVFGIAAPPVYLATLVLALYWIVRWRWVRAGAMLLLVFIGLFKVSLFYRPEFRRVYVAAESGDRAVFKLMTYNVRSFYGPTGKSSVDSVLNLISRENPDIICLQEFNSRLAEASVNFPLLDESYEKAFFGRTEAPDSTFGAPMLILSKFRILHTGSIVDPATSVWADVLMGEDTVRIFSNHLCSTAINAADDAYITKRTFLSDTAREVKIRSIVTRFRDNSALRAQQVDSIVTAVENTPYRKIVVGDFNDTPMSYCYRRMAHGLNDAFSECGSGFSHTYRGFYNTLRIDYVLSCDDLEVLSYEVPKVDFSDHHPVVVRLKKHSN